MNSFTRLCLASVAAVASARAADTGFDRLDEALTWANASGEWRARLSGLLDLEGYALPYPVPGVIDSDGGYLFNPRFSVYLDAQLGPHWYVFAQARADRGFDPSGEKPTARLDEYALRWAPDPKGRFNLQVGAFATVVGNWTVRHDSWSNPFITAPLPYENLTGLWDNEPPHSTGQLLMWSHVRPGLPEEIADEDKYLRIPIIWGPSYSTGVAIAGALETLRYAFEIKNAALSSRPDAWSIRESRWDYPTVSGRVRYVPSAAWEFGFSASDGVFLRPQADEYIMRPHGRGDYRELVLAQDVTFAWHHLQVWAEVYETRFHVPSVANADTVAYYVESKYKFTAQFAGAVRWNQQFFGTISDRGRPVRWGHDVWRVDFAPEFRLTPNLQLKAQYSVQRGDDDANHMTQLLATQVTLRW